MNDLLVICRGGPTAVMVIRFFWNYGSLEEVWAAFARVFVRLRISPEEEHRKGSLTPDDP